MAIILITGLQNMQINEQESGKVNGINQEENKGCYLLQILS